MVARELVVDAVSKDDRPNVPLRRHRADVELHPNVLGELGLEPERIVAHSRREQRPALQSPEASGGEVILVQRRGGLESVLVWQGDGSPRGPTAQIVNAWQVERHSPQ